MRRRPSTSRRLAVVLVATLLALGLTEAVLRAVAPQVTPVLDAYLPDDVAGYVLEPNRSPTTYEAPEFTLASFTNGWGHRDREPASPRTEDELRVLALGDSFTWGAGARYEETHLAIVERALHDDPPIPGRRVRILKAGVPGYNTANEVGYLRKYLPTLVPDLVWINFVPNDVLSNHFDGVQKYKIQDGYLLTADFAKGHAVAGGEIERNPLLSFLRLHCHLYNLVSHVRRAHAAARPPGGGAPPPETLYLRNEPEPVLLAWQETERLLAEARDLCAGSGARLALAYVPMKIQVPPYGPPSAGPVDTDLPTRRLVDLCSRLDVPCLDLLETFREAAVAGEAIYWDKDVHCSPAGERLLARHVEPFLRDLLRSLPRR